MTFKNNRAPLLYYFKLCVSFRSHWWIQTGVTVRKRPIWVKFDVFLGPCDLEIWQMTFKNNRAPLLYNFKLCASFCSHWWIQTGVTVQKRPIGVKFFAFYSCVTLKFDGWSWKAIGHLSQASSSYMHHFITICEFKLELQSGNGQVGLWPLWPWPLTSDLDFCMYLTLVRGDNFWIFHDDIMMGT